MAMKQHAFQKLRLYPAMILVFIAVAIVVPLAIAVIISGYTPDELRKQPSNSYVVAIHAVRVDNNTIKITNLGGEGKPLLIKDLPFLVLINEKNATDIYSLEKNHLPLAIYPETGLGYASGSSVTYTGDDLMANKGVHVLVFGNYKDGVRQNMLDVTIN
jgi:hypothetical protein